MKNMTRRNQRIVFALGMLAVLPCQAQSAEEIFPKGELSTVKNHTGNIWLKELVTGDATFDPSVAVATYDAGARLDWHTHPGGQVLLIIEGAGYSADSAESTGSTSPCKPTSSRAHCDSFPAPRSQVDSARKSAQRSRSK